MRRRCTSAAGAPGERAGDRGAAREAYRRAMSLDPTLAEPVAALGALAAREGDWSEVAKLLESEVGLATSAERKGPLLIELAVVYGDRLGDPGRAVSLLETAGAPLPDDPAPARSGRALSARRAETGRRRPTRSIGSPRAAPPSPTRPSATSPSAAAAEAAGQHDRALTLYSRSYGRDSSYRPTLERLSAICFERGAVGQRLEGDGGAARTPRRRAGAG